MESQPSIEIHAEIEPLPITTDTQGYAVDLVGIIWALPDHYVNTYRRRYYQIVSEQSIIIKCKTNILL